MIPDTISSSEITWFVINSIAMVFILVAMSSVHKDRMAIRTNPTDVNFHHKMEITTWCYTRHSHMLALLCLLQIVVINAMLTPQVVDWSPAVLSLTGIPLIIMSKTCYDVFKKHNLLKAMS